MKDNNKISILLIKHILGELDPNGERELDAWKSKPENIKLYEELINSEHFSDLYRDYLYFRNRKSEIKKSIKRKTLIRNIYGYSKYAAAIIIPLAIFYFISINIDYESSIVTTLDNSNELKLNAPILRLPDGNKIVLDDKLNSTSIKSENIVINNSLREIRYSDNSNILEEKVKISILDIPKCCEYKVYLSDGTMVFLNAMSRLKYPEKFIGDKRVVELEGEGYFEVAKDAKRPFIVKTKGQEVRVLGTKFNINTYSNKIFTTLVEGSVEVATMNKYSNEVGCKEILSPGMQSVVDGKFINLKKVNVEDYVAWVDGEFIFRKQSLEDILIVLGRWYDFEVFYKSKGLKDRLFSVKVKKFERPEELFGLLEKAYDVEFELKGKSLTVSKRYK